MEVSGPQVETRLFIVVGLDIIKIHTHVPIPTRVTLEEQKNTLWFPEFKLLPWTIAGA